MPSIQTKLSQKPLRKTMIFNTNILTHVRKCYKQMSLTQQTTQLLIRMNIQYFTVSDVKKPKASKLCSMKMLKATSFSSQAGN